MVLHLLSWSSFLRFLLAILTIISLTHNNYSMKDRQKLYCN